MQKPWLKSYPEGVSETINPDIFSSIVQVFDQSCETYGSKASFTNMGTTLTYTELDDLSRSFAAYLQNNLGMKKGDRFAIMLPNTLQYPVALFGALRAGLTVVNVNPLYTARELSHQLKDSGAEGILILANFAHVLESVIQDTSVKHVIVTELGDLFPFPKGLLINSVLKYVKKMVPAWNLPAARQLKSVLKSGANMTFQPVKLKGEDVAFLQYTGGTTGVAKGAMLTHRNMVANMEQASEWMIHTLTLGEEAIITALPLYHIFSLTANCLVFMKSGGVNILITNPRDIPGFIKVLKRTRFTAITGVNTLFNALLNHPEFSKVDFSALKICLGGGMAVQRAVADKWQQVTGSTLVEAYGLTETSPAACINPLDLKAYNGSIGLPLPSTEVKIVDDNSQELPMGERGELLIRGPQVMKGYWGRAEATAKVLTDEGWLHTGDIAKIDDQGFVYIVDRKKDMIVVSGFNVYPNEIEDVVAMHPGVLEVAAVGVPDNHSGEVVKIFVVKKDKSLDEAVLIAHCREHLTGYKVPRSVEFRDELPKTNVGKILRRKLKEA